MWLVAQRKLLWVDVNVNNAFTVFMYSSSVTAFFFSSLEILGHVIKSSVVFNSLEKSSSAVESEEDSELKGPVVSWQ